MAIDSETIIALATPRGCGALAVVRISGDTAHEIVGHCVRDRERFTGSRPGHLRRYVLCDEADEAIDEVTAVKYRAPRSFTGEDMVELICHGGERIVRHVLGRLVKAGGRYAGRGEFTRRAFMNGKTTLVQAEAINQLVGNTSGAAVRTALRNYLGGYEGRIGEWNEIIVSAIADLETVIEFGEEHEDTGEVDLVGRAVEGMRSVVEAAREELARRRRVVEEERGVMVALVGPPNAGKSTILNGLLGYERVLVHEEEGTTRDSVGERVRFGETEAYVVDTAGIRTGVEVVERMGVERTWEYVRDAQVVVWITPANAEFTEDERRIVTVRGGVRGVVGVVNKSDLGEGRAKREWFREAGVRERAVCGRERRGVDEVAALIGEAVSDAAGERESTTIIGSERQAAVIERLSGVLGEGIERAGEGCEVMVEFCREALGCLEEFTGKRTTDEILDGVFREFCIGK